MNVFQAMRGDQAGLSKQLCTEWLQTRMGHQLTTHFGIHDVRTHLSVRDILELLHMAEGSCIRVYFHNLLNCNQDTFELHWHEGSLVIAVASVPAGSHWPIVSFGARVKRRPCKRSQNLANLRQKHNKQVPASWESSVLLFIYVEPLSAQIAMRWQYKI